MGDQVSQISEIPMSDMQHMAQAMAVSGFFGFKTPEQALSIMLIAQASGQHPASAALDYDVIQGRPAKKPQAMLRDFLAAGGKVEWHESTDIAADATFSHQRGGSIRVRWDMPRAQKMGLSGKDNYKKQPGVMFRWRCVSEGVRIVYPGATAGMWTPDEVGEFDTLDTVDYRPVVTAPTDTPPAVTKQKPQYSDESIERNRQQWFDLIESGKKTAEQIIAAIETKATLTDEQKDAIMAIGADAFNERLE